MTPSANAPASSGDDSRMSYAMTTALPATSARSATNLRERVAEGPAHLRGQLLADQPADVVGLDEVREPDSGPGGGYGAVGRIGRIGRIGRSGGGGRYAAAGPIGRGGRLGAGADHGSGRGQLGHRCTSRRQPGTRRGPAWRSAPVTNRAETTGELCAIRASVGPSGAPRALATARHGSSRARRPGGSPALLSRAPQHPQMRPPTRGHGFRRIGALDPPRLADRVRQRLEIVGAGRGVLGELVVRPDDLPALRARSAAARGPRTGRRNAARRRWPAARRRQSNPHTRTSASRRPGSCTRSASIDAVWPRRHDNARRSTGAPRRAARRGWRGHGRGRRTFPDWRGAGWDWTGRRAAAVE